MPIYEYACTQCEHSLDALQKLSDPVLVDCPECGQASLQKQLSAPKFRLKGKGWYETDFKTGDKRNIAGDSDKSATVKAKDSDKPASKSDAKGAEKTAPKADAKTTKKKSPDSKASSA